MMMMIHQCQGTAGQLSVEDVDEKLEEKGEDFFVISI